MAAQYHTSTYNQTSSSNNGERTTGSTGESGHVTLDDDDRMRVWVRKSTELDGRDIHDIKDADHLLDELVKTPPHEINEHGTAQPVDVVKEAPFTDYELKSANEQVRAWKQKYYGETDEMDIHEELGFWEDYGKDTHLQTEDIDKKYHDVMENHGVQASKQDEDDIHELEFNDYVLDTGTEQIHVWERKSTELKGSDIYEKHENDEFWKDYGENYQAQTKGENHNNKDPKIKPTDKNQFGFIDQQYFDMEDEHVKVYERKATELEGRDVHDVKDEQHLIKDMVKEQPSREKPKQRKDSNPDPVNSGADGGDMNYIDELYFGSSSDAIKRWEHENTQLESHDIAHVKQDDHFWEKSENMNITQAQSGVHNSDSLNLTHTDSRGKLNMVDIGEKLDTSRVAVATGNVYLGKKAFYLVKDNKLKKGDVLTVAQIAGIMAAKNTSNLIPLCHNISISKVSVDLDLDEGQYAVRVTSVAKTHGKTGVEMEALMAVSLATLTVYDMCKAVSKDIVIGGIKLLKKSGGKSGNFERKN